MVIVRTPSSPKTGEKPFSVLYNPPPNTNTFVIIGGRGGMKTYEVSKFVTFSATIKQKRAVVLRDEETQVKESILNEILLRYDHANSSGRLDEFFNRTKIGIERREDRQMVVFTKGFRASAKEKRANLKSVSNIDIAVVEEAEDIRDEEAFNTFTDSIRNEGAIVIVILNTPDINHFVLKRYFTTVQAKPEPHQTEEDMDGFFDIIPKQIPGVVTIRTGYEDNPHLPERIKEKYKAYGDKDSPFYNNFYYNTAIRGLSTSGRKGQILKKVRPVTDEEYYKLDFPKVYGQDWGNPSPAGTVEVKFHNNTCWVREINYEPMNVIDVGIMYYRMGLMDETIIADGALPGNITKLRNGFSGEELSDEQIFLYPRLLTGWNVFGAPRYPGSVRDGLDKMDRTIIFVTESSANLWHEIQNYVYQQKNTGEYTGEPIDDHNHLIDPLRGVIQARGRYF